MENCPVCNNNELNTIYTGKIRNGSFGKMTDSNHLVFQCTNCQVRFLGEFMDPSFYISSDYRESYNNSSSVSVYHQLHDNNDNEKICKIGLQNLRGKSIVDFGAAAGTFLDVTSSVAKRTYAVEPASFFHESLSLKHTVYSYGADFVSSHERADIATSFDVLEHVENPLEFLQDIYSSLNSGGTMYLMTPNYDDILNDVSKDNFQIFNYRTVHYYYFCKTSIENILKLAGFNNFKVDFHHKYDISNMLFWMKDGKPTGKNKYDFFDDDFNSFYRNYLIKNGKASHLWITAVK